MDKNRKTVRKGFTYLQCDDFADYLSQMAAQGWHFKEWGAGLVFEKGEPEKAVYAVEVFIHGSDYDLRPDDDALNFADYCDAAGWKLIDSKQKYCIFKQIRPDAVPIVTPEERLQNACKAYMKRLWLEVVTAIMFMLSMVLRLLPTSRFIDTLFSNVKLLILSFELTYILCTVGQVIWYIAWKQKTKKRCQAGKHRFLRHPHINFWNLLSFPILILFSVAMAAEGSIWLLVLSASIVLVTLIIALLLAKFRPDRETNIGIQIVLPFVFIIAIIIAAFCIFTNTERDIPPGSTYPLQYEDFFDDAGEIISHSSEESSSIFGTHSYYYLRYEDHSLTYELYETEQNWILDIIWDQKLSYARNTDPIDCTVLWDANTAYHNQIIEYYVRYDDAILVLSVYDDTELTEEQIAIIRDALGLEG